MRYYSNLAQEMTLASGVSAGDTVLSLSSVTGLPASFPFTLVIDPGETSEEIVTCTALFGLSATVTRGSDGTSATAHNAAAKVRHMLTKRDLAEAQEHIAASTNVHGIGSGAVVGTTLSQTLTNKTLSGSSNNFSNIPAAALPSTVVYTTGTQTLTGKTLDGASNTFANIPKTALPSDITYTSTTQTLVNKSISGTSNTLTNLPAAALTGTISKARMPVDTVYDTDTGTVAGSFWRALASGWADNGCNGRIHNGVAHLDVLVSRTGADISSSTNSGAVSDTLICTLVAGYRPPREIVAACRYGGTSGGWVRVLSTGEVFFIHGSPGVPCSTSDTLTATLVFLV